MILIFQVLLLEQSWSELYTFDISQHPQLLGYLTEFIEQSRDLLCNDDMKTLHIGALKVALERLHSLNLDLVECLFLKVIYFLKPGKHLFILSKSHRQSLLFCPHRCAVLRRKYFQITATAF